MPQRLATLVRASDLGGAGSANPLTLSMPVQAMENWCWAAVSLAVAQFFGRHGYTQCSIASALAGTDCCADPTAGTCDHQRSLKDALIAVNSFRDRLDGATSFKDMETEIDSQRPLGVRVQWPDDGGGHFVAIAGYAADQGRSDVVVDDPLDGLRRTMPIGELTDNYRNLGGSWTHSYFVQ